MVVRNAGNFTVWLNALINSLKGKNDGDVPCGDCVGCCTSSYFIHLRPTDAAALQKIPKDIMFSAPGLPRGHYLLGYDEKGHCPMFKAGKCSIYIHRPETCRQYDCRVYPATGLMLDDSDSPVIAEQARRWQFDISTDDDRQLFYAVQRAADFITVFADRFPAGVIPGNTPQRAVFALRVHELFIDETDDGMKENAEALVSRIVSTYG